ncbi:MAG: hypothetical protein HY049_08855 [Acidobacteria bacterium]|nr:hypothetical protein [Acidobacteriota bacterium]
METLKPGNPVWIPCEVKPGPFSNERMVRVTASREPWVGFVDIRYLKEPIADGRTSILGVVVSVSRESLEARLPGHSVGSSRLFQGTPSMVTLAPVSA